MPFGTGEWYRSESLIAVTSVGDEGWVSASATSERVTVSWSSKVDLPQFLGLLDDMPRDRVESVRLLDEQSGMEVLQYPYAGSVIEVASAPYRPLEVTCAAPDFDFHLLGRLGDWSNVPFLGDWVARVYPDLDKDRSSLVRPRVVTPPPRAQAACLCDVGAAMLVVSTWVQASAPCRLSARQPALLWVVVNNRREKPEPVRVRVHGLTDVPVTCVVYAAGGTATWGSTEFVAPAVGPRNVRFEGHKIATYPAPLGPAKWTPLRMAKGQVYVV